MIGSTFGPMSRGSSDDEMFGKVYDINVIKKISPFWLVLPVLKNQKKFLFFLKQKKLNIMF